MEIRNNPAANHKPTMATDITRPVREGIQERAPELPREASEANDLASIKKRAKHARDQVRHEQLMERAHKARKRVTERAYKRADNFRKKIKDIDIPLHGKPVQGPDKVDVSAGAQALGVQPDRAERVAELKRLFEDGNLNTRDLIARTAFRMLGGTEDR